MEEEKQNRLADAQVTRQAGAAAGERVAQRDFSTSPATLAANQTLANTAATNAADASVQPSVLAAQKTVATAKNAATPLHTRLGD